MPMPRLEVFKSPGLADETSPFVTIERSALEELRLSAYEQGYRAGWEDAETSSAQEEGKLRSDIARSLQSLSFTWQEARSHILGSLEPLLYEIVDRVLPVTARETFAPVILEQLMPLADEIADQPAIIALNPSMRAQVEKLITEATGLPLIIEEDHGLAQGQAYLRLGQSELKVDLDRAIAEIRTAIHAFFTLSEENPSNG